MSKCRRPELLTNNMTVHFEAIDGPIKVSVVQIVVKNTPKKSQIIYSLIRGAYKMFLIWTYMSFFLNLTLYLGIFFSLFDNEYLFFTV